MSFSTIIPAKNKFINHHKNGGNSDIIKTFFARYNEAMEQGKKIAPFFQKKSFAESCFLVWNFVKYNIKYEVDPEGTQLIQLPSYLLNTSRKGDCKSKTLLCAAIISNFNFNGKRPIVTIIFTNYEDIKSYTHVYMSAKLDDQEFIVDPVYFDFNKQKPYFSKKIYTMEINSVSGFGEATQEEINGRKSKKNKSQKAKNRADRKKKRKERGGKLFKGAKKVSLAAPRGAFLSLVMINARGLATKLLNAPGSKVIKIWDTLGGNPEKLKAAINKGAAKKPFLGSKVSEVEGLEHLEGIGVVGAASVATLLVSAAGVLAAFAPILKMVEKNKNLKSGASTDEILKETEEEGGDTSIPEGELDPDDADPGSSKSEKKKSKSSSGGGFSLDSIDFSDPITLALIFGGGYLGGKALKIF